MTKNETEARLLELAKRCMPTRDIRMVATTGTAIGAFDNFARGNMVLYYSWKEINKKNNSRPFKVDESWYSIELTPPDAKHFFICAKLAGLIE